MNKSLQNAKKTEQELENVIEFIKFSRASGGFEVC